MSDPLQKSIKVLKVKRTFWNKQKADPWRSLGSDNFHKEQCDAIPEKFDESLHGIHLEC